ncbi:hypothetical protein TNCV_2275111 [Trichonephila clavipes]|nr:hypothetical protein TNCV_2275111 [Trichonephila clavipes]
MGHERKRRQKKRKFHGNFRTAQKKKKVSEGSISSEKLGRGLSDTLFNVDSETLSAGKKLFSMLNIPYPSKCTYRQHEIKLLHAASQAANNSMLESAKSIAECSNECGVSVDGTWQKRGYSFIEWMCFDNFCGLWKNIRH